MNQLRICSGCSAHILTNDATSENAWCTKCRSKHVEPFGEWSAGLVKGDLVYLQPYAAWRGLSRSKYLIVDRDGDELTVQAIGMPESRVRVNVAHTGQHDMTPRLR